MTIQRQFDYSRKKITALVTDTGDNYTWVAFDQNSDGNVVILKESSFKPKRAFFTLERSITKCTALDYDSSNVYASYEDGSLLGEIISKNQPLTSTTEIDLPGSVNESPVDVLVDGSDLFFLLPGSSSGENAKILQYNTSGTLQGTIDLTDLGVTITNAKTFTRDTNTGDLWVITSNSPLDIVRVFQQSGGNWTFNEFQT